MSLADDAQPFLEQKHTSLDGVSLSVLRNLSSEEARRQCSFIRLVSSAHHPVVELARSLFDTCGSDAEHSPIIAVLGTIRRHPVPTEAPAGIDRASGSDEALSHGENVFCRVGNQRCIG